jgi:hypothetical protein
MGLYFKDVGYKVKYKEIRGVYMHFFFFFFFFLLIDFIIQRYEQPRMQTET